MTTTPDLSYALTLPPEQAVKYFQAKGYKITWDWHEMWQEAHAKAFTVAKVTNSTCSRIFVGRLIRPWSTAPRLMTSAKDLRFPDPVAPGVGTFYCIRLGD
jgi:hypothetical protein